MHHPKTRASASRNFRNFATFLTALARLITRWNWSYYIGGAETANRLEAQNLKNRETLNKIEQGHNKLVLQDLDIEKKTLEIEKLRRELGISAGEFTASNYADPGNIREDERRGLK